MSDDQTTETTETTDTTSAAADTDAQQSTDAQSTETDASTATTTEQSKPETFSREYVEKLRRENAAAREKAKTEAATAAEAATSALTQSIGKALGLVKDDEKVDPEALIAQAQTERQAAIDEANATRRDLAVLRNAAKHDANTDELLDSATFNRKLAALDPSADDFASQVDALIAETVTGNPTKFKRVQVAASAGGTTHSGEGTSQLSREQLAALPPAERLKAAKEGRLNGLLGK